MNLEMNGAVLIDKHAGVSSFGVIELLQKQLTHATGVKRRELPKLGHGGTLDPFATGLLPVLVGRGVKLARYFLGSTKVYEGVFRFGETTVPGDPTSPITETTDRLPESRERIQEVATLLTKQPYLQTPPMHSAKKVDGKPLYELARQGIEIEREPKLCRLHEFQILPYEAPRARFRLVCSSGTYVRTLAQDLAKMLGSLALVESLSRAATGGFDVKDAWTSDRIGEALAQGQALDTLPCWVPFDGLLREYGRAEATREEAQDLFHGRQNVLFNILRRAGQLTDSAADVDDGSAEESAAGVYRPIYCEGALIAVARREPQGPWGLERVFTP